MDAAFRAAPDLPAVERAFAHEVSYGVARLRGRLDHLLKPWIEVGWDRLHDDVRILLRMGLYQLIQLDRVPDYAAVSQTVDQVVEAGQPRAKGLVNAVLRRASDGGGGADWFPDPEEDPAGWLSTWGSHPLWLIHRWLMRWSFEEVKSIVEADNVPPATHFVPLSDDLEAAASALAAAGIEVTRDPVSRTLRLPTTDPTAALAAVPGFIQDPAAATVCRYAAVPEGAIVADLCAAPGGKALSLGRSAGYVLAADPAASRLGLIEENRDRTGLPIGVVRARGEAPPVAAADVVLVDAPCSGTGTLRRHPDARWRLEATDPGRLAEVQARILHGAATAVRPGGWLVYSTCTLEPEENRVRVEAFLEEHPEFELDPPEDSELTMTDDGMLELIPRTDLADGAFAARLRRKDGV